MLKDTCCFTALILMVLVVPLSLFDSAFAVVAAMLAIVLAGVGARGTYRKTSLFVGLATVTMVFVLFHWTVNAGFYAPTTSSIGEFAMLFGVPSAIFAALFFLGTRADTFRIAEFESTHQNAASRLINSGLGEHFGFVDETMNPDLFDIESSYRDEDFLLAFMDDVLVGTGALTSDAKGAGQISRMHTLAEFRRKGIASRMLQELERRAAARGFSSLVLETNLDWDDANAFYQRNGYEELGRNEVGIRYQKVITSQ